MKRFMLLTLFAGAIFGIVFVGVTAYAQDGDQASGTIPATVGPAPDGLITCTLSVSPSTVSNGEVFVMTVTYSPSISGDWVEKFSIFPWNSVSPTFNEITIRGKQFIGFGAVSASFESAVAPAATNINGVSTVNVDVIQSGATVCSASTTLTVS